MKSIHPTRLGLLAGTALFLLPSLAMAHPGHFGHGDASAFSSLISGFSHPFSGLDHMILAVAVGWLSFTLGARKAAVPAIAFLTALALGAFSGRGVSAGVGLEIGLAATLLAAGVVMIWGTLRKSGKLSLLALPAGFIHGFAHGAETLPNLSFSACAVGFVIATALLLGMGGLLHYASSYARRPQFAIRLAGAAVIVLGAASLIQSI